MLASPVKYLPRERLPIPTSTTPVGLVGTSSDPGARVNGVVDYPTSSLCDAWRSAATKGGLFAVARSAMTDPSGCRHGCVREARIAVESRAKL
jgi:hypothetical protein